VTLRARITAWFVALHLLLAAAGVFVLLKYPLWLFVVEAAFIVSILISYRVLRALFVPLDLVRTGAQLISDRDFTTRFVPIGQPEMDALIDVYNRMIDRLREERLAAEEERHLLESIVEASPSGIVICDFDGNVEQLNPAAQRLVTPDLLAEMRTLGAGESRLVARDLPRRMKVWRAEFRDRGFAKSFFIVDEMTEELRLSEKAAYEKLIRMMSHEVNNSVGAVRSLLESALRYAPQVGESDREDFVNALTISSSRIDALNRFMTGFADVVRIPPPRRSRVALGPLIERIATFLRPDLASIVLTTTVDDTIADIDESQFEQVLINVIRNAADSIGSNGGAIDITLRDGSLTIADTGAGIADEDAADLFTPFFTTKRDGRGLGLTIVQEILANHGFPYSLQNRAGGGAEFRVGVATYRGVRTTDAPPSIV
jgi:nitrogen fixation/metabolism regulation signal transduction histidine kinase